MLRTFCCNYRKALLSGFCAVNSTTKANFSKSTNLYANAIPAFRKQPQRSNDILKFLLLAIPVGSFGLGTWQIYRLQWKRNLVADLKEKSSRDPIEFPQDLHDLNTLEYSPVRIKGRFKHEQEFLIGPRSLIEDKRSRKERPNGLISDPKKNQGWLVVTPFQLSDSGDVILVNRGWIPQSLRPQELRRSSLIKGEVELVGVVRLTETRPPFMPKNQPENRLWFYRDLGEMSSFVNCSPVWLDACGIPDPPEGWPIPNQTKVTLRNEHLAYIITWYTLSLISGIMWHRNFIKRLPLL